MKNLCLSLEALWSRWSWFLEVRKQSKHLLTTPCSMPLSPGINIYLPFPSDCHPPFLQLLPTRKRAFPHSQVPKSTLTTPVVPRLLRATWGELSHGAKWACKGNKEHKGEGSLNPSRISCTCSNSTLLANDFLRLGWQTSTFPISTQLLYPVPTPPLFDPPLPPSDLQGV